MLDDRDGGEPGSLQLGSKDCFNKVGTADTACADKEEDGYIRDVGEAAPGDGGLDKGLSSCIRDSELELPGSDFRSDVLGSTLPSDTEAADSSTDGKHALRKIIFWFCILYNTPLVCSIIIQHRMKMTL